MGPVTIILSDKPITHNTGKSIVANIPMKRRGPNVEEVIQTIRCLCWFTKLSIIMDTHRPTFNFLLKICLIHPDYLGHYLIEKKMLFIY